MMTLSDDSGIRVQSKTYRPDHHSGDNPNTTQTLEYTKDKYNVKIIK
jgi:hypothetical protein